MRIPRIYQDLELQTGEEIQLADDTHHHLHNVLRLRKGQKINLFNGQGGYYIGEIISIDKHETIAIVKEHIAEERESPLTITLVQGISRGQRMDYTLQKSVELGVSEIIPVITRYSGVSLDEKQRQKRMEHWRGIIISACEQCGRNRIPELHTITTLEQWLDQKSPGLKLILHPDSAATFDQLNLQPEKIYLVAGPEGGFSEEEITQARENDCKAIKLGPRILRTETAALTALTACQVIWGDLK